MYHVDQITSVDKQRMQFLQIYFDYCLEYESWPYSQERKVCCWLAQQQAPACHCLRYCLLVDRTRPQRVWNIWRAEIRFRWLIHLLTLLLQRHFYFKHNFTKFSHYTIISATSYSASPRCFKAIAVDARMPPQVAVDVQSRVPLPNNGVPGTGEQAAAVVATNGVSALRIASQECRRLANANVKTAKVRCTA